MLCSMFEVQHNKREFVSVVDCQDMSWMKDSFTIRIRDCLGRGCLIQLGFYENPFMRDLTEHACNIDIVL